MNALQLIDTIAPSFAGVPTSTKEVFLGIAREHVNACRWGKMYETGVAYFAAHLMEKSNVLNKPLQRLQGPGAAKSLKTGNESITFADVSSMANTIGDAALSETSYGRMYLYFRSTRAATMPKVL